MDLVHPLAMRLARQFRVIIVQPRGEDQPYDLSSRATLEDLALDVLDFQESLGLERPLVLGLSFGGLVAIQAASLRPIRFSGVIAQGVGPQFTRTLLQRVTSQVLRWIYLPHDSSFVNQFFDLAFGMRWVLPELRQAVAELCWRTDQGVMARRFGMAENFDLEPLVDGLRQVPLLIQTAANDVVVSPEAWKPWRRALPKMTCQTIAGAGHLAFLTHLEQVSEQVERFANRRLGVAAQLST
jgi:pimeloyl-ACP methyl ester carboxylesterase